MAVIRAEPHYPSDKYLNDAEKCIVEKLSFDDVAVMSIYLYADAMFMDKAKKVMKKFKKVCGHVDDVKHMDEDDIEALDWKQAYNLKFAQILENNGLEPMIDEYGALGWIDKCGGKHFGDDYYIFPLYADKETLEKDLKEFNENCEEL